MDIQFNGEEMQSSLTETTQTNPTQLVHVATTVSEGVGIQEEEMFDDIVANTNPVLAALPTAEDLIMANLYVHPTLSFFNAK